MKKCPDCKDGTYTPFVGPVEPCATCKGSTWVPDPECADGWILPPAPKIKIVIPKEVPKMVSIPRDADVISGDFIHQNGFTVGDEWNFCPYRFVYWRVNPEPDGTHESRPNQ